MRRVTKEEVKRAKSNRTVQMILDKEHHKKVVKFCSVNSMEQSSPDSKCVYVQRRW